MIREGVKPETMRNQHQHNEAPEGVQETSRPGMVFAGAGGPDAITRFRANGCRSSELLHACSTCHLPGTSDP